MKDITPESFPIFHRENPALYAKFCEVTFANIGRKNKRISALGMLYEVRKLWDGVRFPNKIAPYYARAFNREHPAHAIFKERPSEADRAPDLRQGALF